VLCGKHCQRFQFRNTSQFPNAGKFRNTSHSYAGE
jgi:hypothetical protein